METMTGIIFIFSLLLSLSAEPASLPAAQDINNVSAEAKLAYDGFLRDSYALRLEYEFAGRFSGDEHRSKMRQFAEQANEKITAIETKQRELKKQIEDYQGSDWEQKFGSTGLWRKLTADVHFTSVSNCQISFYLAISQTDKKIRVEILKAALDKIEGFEKSDSRPAAEEIFLKARILGTLAADDLLYRPPAREEFESAIGKEKTGEKKCSGYRLIFEEIKLLGPADEGQLKTLARQFFISPCKDDLELVLSLAGLQYRLGKKDAFEETVRKNPRAQDIIGSFLLAGLLQQKADENSFESTTVFEAELTAKRALKEGAAKYSELLLKLADEFQTPIVFYAAAQAFADSSPEKTIDFLIQSSILQNRKKSEWLDADANTIAGQAARFALDRSGKHKTDCGLIIKACENYRSIAAGNTEPKLDYLYAEAVLNCGQNENGEAILQGLAKRDAGFWSARAKLDLIEKKINAAKTQKQPVSDSAISELNNFISENSVPDEWAKRLGGEAAAVYCQALIEAADKQSLEKIVSIIDVNKINYEPNLGAFKSAALQKLDRPAESAKWLLAAFRPSRCEHAPQATALLTETVGKIDYLKEQSADFAETAAVFEKLATECCNCADSAGNPSAADLRQVKLLRAEFAIFAAAKEPTKLEKIEKLLNSIEPDNGVSNVDLLRCRARLFAEQKKFQQAAQLWSQICGMEESGDPASKQRSERWWRAKYYELYCWSQIPQTNKKDTAHTIDVLGKTYDQKPDFWWKKLDSLKQTIPKNSR
jgi:uncharacterized protein YdcH (DUF465 family)